MPRIRIRTSEGERIVGTPSCSTLTVQLVAHAQRHTLQLRADAKLMADAAEIEHVSWEWPELPDSSTVELISEPTDKPYAAYDPPDRLHPPASAVAPDAEAQHALELAYRAAQRELQEASEQLEKLTDAPMPLNAEMPASGSTPELNMRHCAFCGRNQHQVRQLVAGATACICNECVDAAKSLLAD